MAMMLETEGTDDKRGKEEDSNNVRGKTYEMIIKRENWRTRSKLVRKEKWKEEKRSKQVKKILTNKIEGKKKKREKERGEEEEISEGRWTNKIKLRKKIEMERREEKETC